jgi:phospholipid/cholesterol/gamma-HCH transport system substrate-binding protein
VRGLSRAVTIAVFLLTAGGATWFIASRVGRPSVGQRFRTFAMFRDGSGLPVGSQVVIAGVRVGEIDHLSIDRGLARIGMRLRDDVVIWNDAWAAKRASSLLGDSYIEILPGGPAEGAAPDPGVRRLASNEQIPHVLEAGSTERVLRQIHNAMPRIDSQMLAAEKALLSTRRWVAGPFSDSFAYADRYLESGAIADPIESAAAGAKRFSDWTAGVADGTRGVAGRVNPVLEDFARRLDSASEGLVSAEVAVHEALVAARARMNDLDPYLDRANAAIAEYDGDPRYEQGAMAKLINDGELGEDLHDATGSVKGFTDGLNRAVSFMGIRGELNVFARSPRLYVVAEIDGRNDKFYLIELEKGGLGQLPKTTLSDATGSDLWTLRSSIRDGVRFSAQIGKRFNLGAGIQARFRFGFKESAIGAGSDLDVFDRRLRLSADVYDATFARAPRLKLTASVTIFKYITLLAGIDDALNPPGYLPIAAWPAGEDVPSYLDEVRYGRDYFVGGMLTLTNADLATLLRIYCAVIVAGLVD